MSISAFNAGFTGMQAFQRALGTSGHNVANSLTDGFKPQQAALQEGASGGVAAIVSGGRDTAAAFPAEAGGTDLENEMVQSLQYKHGFDLSAKVVKTSDEVMGTLLNIKA